jgi:putative ABC transport system permease protein
MACVVGVFISILSLQTGYKQTIDKTGRKDRAIVLSQGAQFEFASALQRDATLKIADAPGIKKTAGGKPIVSSDAFSFVVVTKKSNGLDAYVDLRGVTPEGLALRPEMKLIKGRMFKAGAHELIAGAVLDSQFEGLGLGSKVSLPEGDWTVTGVFESNGSAHESELFTDAATLLSALRSNTFKSIKVMLDSPDAFEGFKKAVTTDPTLTVDVFRETDYMTNASRPLNQFLTTVAYVIGGVMGLGAVFGALNTMYSAVSARTVEIATLRALGFGGGAVVVSVLAEALLLAFVGAAIGVAGAWAAFNGNAHTFGSLVFSLRVTPDLALFGVALACGLGLIGGLFPAIRAARLPVATALRGN